MASARVMFKGFIVMVVLIAAGIIMSFGFGMITDQTVSSFDGAGIYAIDDPNWSGFYSGTTEQGINLLYLVCYLPPVIGIAYFLLCVFRSYWRQEDDDY